MDVVKTNISRLNGTVEIATHKDKGNTSRSIFPLPLPSSRPSWFVPAMRGSRYHFRQSKKHLPCPRVTFQIWGGLRAISRAKVYPLFALSSAIGDVRSLRPAANMLSLWPSGKSGSA